MDNTNGEIDQEITQEREAANTNNGNDLNEDASLESIPEPDSMSETNRKENENIKEDKMEKQEDHILQNIQDKVIGQETPDGIMNEEEYSCGGVYDKSDQKRNCNSRSFDEIEEGDTTCENTPDTVFANGQGCGEEISDENDTKRVSNCDPCLFDEIEENANAFCVVCVEYLCKCCTRDHRKSKATRNHKVLLDDEIPKDPEVFKLMKSLACCSEHPDMEVSFKCRIHEKFICTKCLVVSHMKCENVSEASKVDRSFIDDETESSLSDMLKEVHYMTVSARVGKEENIEKLHWDNVCVREEQSEFIKSLHEHLAKLENKLKTETEEILTNVLNALEEEVDQCKDIEKQEIKYAELLDVAMKYGNTVELNVISALVKKEAETLKDKTKQQESNTAVRLKFERNQSFTDVATIGNVSVLRGQKNDDHRDEILLENSSDVAAETSSDAGGTSQKRPLMQSSVSRTRTMHDLHHTTSGARLKCSVTSMLILADGRVVITDYNNEHIKLLNKDLSVKRVYKLEGEPIDMCQTSKYHLTVIFDGLKMINRYIVAKNIIHDDGGFQSKLYPISIEKSNESDTYVIILFSDEERNTSKKSNNDTIEIQIRCLQSGSIIKQLTDFKAKSWNKIILENPSRVRVMPKVQNAFLISESKKLHCFYIDQTRTNTINEMWYYKSHTSSVIDDTTDIAVDKEGNIYVCGKGSKNIHQISGSNFMNNRVLFSVPGTPLSICVDDERRRLFVGCENDNFIYVVALK